MRIAVTSQNFRTVTGHAGRARRFIVFSAQVGESPQEIERLDLDADTAFYSHDHRDSHPLDSMNVLITSGAGQGFVNNLAARGVTVVATPESDPQRAVEAFLAGRVLPASAGCNHNQSDRGIDDHHDHGDTAHPCNCRS